MANCKTLLMLGSRYEAMIITLLSAKYRLEGEIMALQCLAINGGDTGIGLNITGCGNGGANKVGDKPCSMTV